MEQLSIEDKILADNGYVGYQPVLTKVLAEHAKQTAIGFFKWLYENYNEVHDGLPISGNTTLGGMTIYIDGTEHPFEYAYELYTQSLNK